MANVTEMPAQEGQIDQDIPAESTPEPTTPASKSARKPPNKGGRPKPSANAAPNPDPTFFKKVAAIPAEDWGTRAFMYVYIDEPVCVEKTWGQYSYALKCKQPILDLEPLKERYGSHKGWLSLNTRKSGKDATDQIDRYDYEIFDPLCPPKIPRGAWANDTRNDRWRALLPAEKPQASDAATSLRDAMGVLRDVKAELRDEMQPAPEPVNGARETLETMKLAKDLFAPKETNAAGALNPLELLRAAKELATPPATDNKMLETIVTLLQGQIASQAEELKQLRQHSAPVPQKGLLEQVVELAALGDKLEPVKKLLGFGGSTVETATRTARTTPLDVARDLGREFFNSDLSRSLGHWLGSLAERNMAQNPAPNGNGNGAQPRQTITSDPFSKFIEDIVNPKMMMYFNADPSRDGGESFADWIYAGFPEFFQRLQNFEHPRLPGLKGAAAIITGYKNTPHVWNQVRPEREVQFAEFVNGFCDWKIPTEDAEDAEVIEPSTSGMEEGYEQPENEGRVS